MADQSQRAQLLNDVQAWNRSREKNFKVLIDLHKADLVGVNLIGAHLLGADLSEANLLGADLSRANLMGAYLVGADLREANLIGADLIGAKLSKANLLGANLREADLRDANLSSAILSGSCLENANFESARLQFAILDGATATGIQLWEVQRGGWSIKGIICGNASWGKDGTEIVQYAPGEFEKLFSTQSCIELLYKGGITTFQLNTLPLLLYRLTEENPGSAVRLSRVEEAAGGTKVVLTVEEGDTSQLQKRIERIQEWQMAAELSEKHSHRIEGLFRDFINVLPKLTEASAMKTNNFNGPVGNYIEGGDHHQVTSHQTIAAAIQDIAAAAQRKSSELCLSAEDSQKLQSALANLNQQHAQPAGIVKESLLSVRHILEHAAGAMIGHEWLPPFVAKVEMALRSLGS